jgi:glycerol uptake facilitator-like aquaporin
VIFGCRAAVVVGATAYVIALSGIGLLGISLAFGINVVAMAYTIEPISGLHSETPFNKNMSLKNSNIILFVYDFFYPY